MEIEPQSIIPLVYQITDPTDATVYFVRAVIRDSLTGSTIGTKNLTSQGSGRYTSSTLAPADSTGFGRHIDITITVYTDSGYSVVSTTYARIIDKYLSHHKNVSFGGGTGGAEIDYLKLQKMIDNSLEKALEGMKPKELDLNPVYEAIRGIGMKIDTYEQAEEPENEEIDKPVDFSPVLNSLKDTLEKIIFEIKHIDFPEEKEIDFSPLLQSLQSISEKVDAQTSMSSSHKEEIKKGISDAIESVNNSAQTDRAKQLSEISSKLAGLIGGNDLPEQNKKDKKSIISPYIKK